VNFAKFLGGGRAIEKIPKIKKMPKNRTIKLLPGGQGGSNGKKIEKQHYLASIYYICTMYENPGGPRPPSPRCRRTCMDRNYLRLRVNESRVLKKRFIF